MKNDLKKLTKENLQQIILDMKTFLSKEQQQQLENLIVQYASGSVKAQSKQKIVRMSQELVDEKMAQLKHPYVQALRPYAQALRPYLQANL
mgnify:CR=1 FL=1